MSKQHTSERAQTRQSLLSELESIRALLREPDHGSAPLEPPTLEIPVLHESIPLLDEHIPTLLPESATDKQADNVGLDDVRLAAARVAALAVRSRHSTPSPAIPTPPAINKTELVQLIIDALRPELEQLLHRIITEKLSDPPTTSPEKR